MLQIILPLAIILVGSMDFIKAGVSDEVTDNVVENILNDDEVWGHIDDAIYYFLGKELNK